MTTNESRAAMLEGFADYLDGPNWRGMAEALRAGAEALRAAADHHAGASGEGPALIDELNSTIGWLKRRGDRLDANRVQRAVAALAARPVVDDAMVERIRALHQPKKIWESDRSYTMVCSSCQLTAYPCPTIAALTPDEQEKNR